MYKILVCMVMFLCFSIDSGVDLDVDLDMKERDLIKEKMGEGKQVIVIKKVGYSLKQQWEFEKYTRTLDSIKALENDSVKSLEKEARLLNKKADKLIFRSPVRDSLLTECYHLNRQAAQLAVQARKELRDNFPITTLVLDHTADLERKTRVIKTAGVFQILVGATGMVCTIVDATKEKKISYDVPQYSSTGKLTGTEKTTITYKPEWVLGHTILMILSGGMFISGVITVNF